MKKTVFISSTYKDLKEYREAVWDVLEKHSVNVKGMEKFGASKETPLESCLNEIKQSDIYIGIIGMIYGSIDKNTGKSFTQLEYEEAPKYDIDIHIYLIDEIKTKFYIKDIDFKNAPKLRKFKSMLKTHTCKFFSNPINLSNHINDRLNESTNSTIVSRPKYLKAKLFNFKHASKDIRLILSYYKDRAYEMWVQHSDELQYSKNLIECIIKEVRVPNKRVRYDIEYMDNEGYIIVQPAIDRIFEDMNEGIYSFSRSISALLTENTALPVILEFINNYYFSEEKNIKSKAEIAEIIANNLFLKSWKNSFFDKVIAENN